MKYRCRSVIPKAETWTEIEEATPEDAVQAYHDRNTNASGSLVFDWEKPTGREIVYFARVEVEGEGEGEGEGEEKTYVSRMFFAGIYRRGGVRPIWPTQEERLAQIAKALQWKGAPEELLAEGWDGEETYDAASARKWQQVIPAGRTRPSSAPRR